MSRAFVLVILAGCAFDRGGLAADGVVPDADPTAPDADLTTPAPDADPAAVDANPDPACITWNAANVADPCDPALGTPGTIMLVAGRNRYDTDTGVLTAPAGATSTPPSVLISQPGGPQARALVLTGLSIPAGTALVASGSRPLIVIVHGDVTIAGTIDVSATVDNLDVSTPGAGGDDATMCDDGIPDPGQASGGAGGAGGGGGGGYAEDGGDGGDGNGASAGGKAGKGSKNGNATIVPLRGGCRGSAGGDDSNGLANDAGRAGNGGGGVEVTALGAITISGTVAASGTGGAGVALVNAGAGGGGSGGAILLDGDVLTITMTAKLCANGGGGGEGGATQLATSDEGEHATCVEAPRADGGDGIGNGGKGGDGGVLATPAATNASNGTSGGAGGGGGGGVGRIRTLARSTLDLDVGSIISPSNTN